MSVNLNEFSIEELEFAKKVFQEKGEDLMRTLLRVEVWGDSEVRNSIINESNKRLDACLLWKVQIQNAINELALQHN